MHADWGSITSSTLSHPHRHGPACLLVRRGTHQHTPQGSRESWHCSHTVVLSGCRRETFQCRIRLAAWHTPGSTGSHPTPAGLLWDTGVQDWGKGRACHTAGTTPAGTVQVRGGAQNEQKTTFSYYVREYTKYYRYSLTYAAHHYPTLSEHITVFN